MDFIVLILIILLLPMVYAAIIGAPILNTSRKRIGQIIEETEIKDGNIVYELGSGFGEMTLAFSKNPNIKAIGFELSPIFFFVSVIKKFILKRKNASFRLKNFYNADLSGADIVYFYLMPRSIEKLKIKLEKELKSETKVISFGFPIKEWTAEKVIRGENLPSAYFYAR